MSGLDDTQKTNWSAVESLPWLNGLAQRVTTPVFGGMPLDSYKTSAGLSLHEFSSL